MFGKRCTLCGGKLVNNICVECGLDNRKSDKYYKLNESSCDGEPLTHVHGDVVENKHQGKKTKKHKKGVIGKVITVIVIVSMASEIGGSIIKSLSDSFSSSFSQQISDIGNTVENATGFSLGNGSPDYEKDGEYEYVSRPLEKGGNTVDATLSAGFYEVGVQIPEGAYTITLENGKGYFTVDDMDNSIYIWANMDEDNSYGDSITEATDVRMYEGAMLQIDGNVTLRLTADDAVAEGGVEMIANPLTEAVTLKETATAGKELEPGVYDLTAVTGSGWVELYVPGFTSEDADGEAFQTESVDLAAESDYTGQTMKNVVIPEGTKLSMENVEVKFTPSETITSEDYIEFYKQHYLQ